MRNEYLRKFGSNLKKIRKDKNLSQETLGLEVGLHRTYIGMLERGEKNISLLNIIKISKTLNIRIEELCRDI